MKNSETPLYSEEKQEHLIRQEVLGKTKENLTQALNAESYQEDEIKRIYGLEDNFVSPWDKQLAKEQNKPENLIALSEYFLKHPEYDENLTLKHITKLPRGFHFPKNLKGKLSLPNLVTLSEDIKIPTWVIELYLPELKKYPNNNIFPENLEKLTIGIEELLDNSPLPSKLISINTTAFGRYCRYFIGCYHRYICIDKVISYWSRVDEV